MDLEHLLLSLGGEISINVFVVEESCGLVLSDHRCDSPRWWVKSSLSQMLRPGHDCTVWTITDFI